MPGCRRASRRHRLRGRDLGLALSGGGPAGLSPGRSGRCPWPRRSTRSAASRRDGRPGAPRWNTRGPKIAAAALECTLPGTSSSSAEIHRAMLGCRPGAAVLDVESVSPLVISSYAELREPANPGCAAFGPWRRWSSTAGSIRRATRTIRPRGDAGLPVKIEVEASELGSALDGVLQVEGNNGAVIANADDTTMCSGRPAGQGTSSIPDPVARPDRSRRAPTRSPWSSATSKGAGAWASRTGSWPTHHPGFELKPTSRRSASPGGGPLGLGVTVNRKGYAGPITLDGRGSARRTDRSPGDDRRPGRQSESLVLGSPRTCRCPACAGGQGAGAGGTDRGRATTDICFRPAERACRPARSSSGSDACRARRPRRDARCPGGTDRGRPRARRLDPIKADASQGRRRCARPSLHAFAPRPDRAGRVHRRQGHRRHRAVNTRPRSAARAC